MVSVGGHCDTAFTAVRDAFVGNFDDGEVGAACCVTVEGRVVVDIWGGWCDEACTRPWQGDTLVNAYSVGKPMVALALLRCVAAGLIDLDEPAARWWPEFVAGRQGATVRDALCHRAGVPSIRARLGNDALWDWDTMCHAVAATEPWWTPGTKHAYHVNTYGFVTGELARRVTGQQPGAWFAEHVAGPLGADAAWGLDAKQQARCADVIWQANLAPAIDWSNIGDDEHSMIALGYFNPPGIASLGVVNTPAWRATQVPSTNLHASARGVARVYAALAEGGTIDGVTVLDADLLAEATTPQSEGWCPFLERDVTFGLGFQPTRPDRPFGPNEGSFGHFGSGGALGFADPSASLAFGYVMNAVKPRWQNARNRALRDTLYSCL